MKVELKQITPNIEQFIVEIARVSSTREDKQAEPEKLINYLIRNKHWSPFEHGYITLEIETSRAIATQFLRHRSFTFQELSQRYADINNMFDDIFEPISLRKQAASNRQSSEEEFDPFIEIVENGYFKDCNSSKVITNYLQEVKNLYTKLLEAEVAKECARMILPLTTKTRLYMTGNVRSWIHFLELRDDSHAQLEAQLIAKEIKKILVEQLPLITKALEYENIN